MSDPQHAAGPLPGLDALPQHPVWQRWQRHMSDMLVQQDGRPLTVPLQRMFWMQAATN